MPARRALTGRQASGGLEIVPRNSSRTCGIKQDLLRLKSQSEKQARSYPLHLVDTQGRDE